MKSRLIPKLTILTLAAVALPVLAEDPSSTTLPPEQHAGSISYITGGVGSNEAKAMEAQIDKHTLAIELLEKTANRDEFTGDATVDITDQSGTSLLSAQSDGPFMLVDLPPGRYTVTATINGKELKKSAVVIAENKTARATFVFPASVG
jgi:hypothetical protein